MGIFQGAYFNYPYLKLANLIQYRENVYFYGNVVYKKKNQLVISVNKIYDIKHKRYINIKFKMALYIFLKKNSLPLEKNYYVKVYSRLLIPHNRNPGAFNFETYLKGRGIQFVSYVHCIKNIKILKKEHKNNFIETYREFIKNKIRAESIPDFYKGLIIAITTGDKSFLYRNSKKFIIKNGISHLFSISGLHVGTFFLFSLIILRIVFFKLNNFYLPYICALPLTVFYLIFMGNNLPAIRAGFILIMFVLSLFIKRYKDSYDTLGLIFLLLIISSPYSFLNLSFQYSFIVVFALIFYAKNRVYKNGINDFFAILIIAFLAGVPLSCYYFSKIYLKSIVANIVAVPVFTFFIIPFTILLIFSGGINFLVVSLTQIIYFLMKVVKIILDSLGDFTPVYIHSFDVIEIILWYAVVFIIIYLIANISKMNKFILNKIFVSLSVLIFLIVCYGHFFEKKSFIGIIDVNREEAVIIKDKKNYLIATLNNINHFQRDILPVLLKKRVYKIDYLIIPFVFKNMKTVLSEFIQIINVKNIIVNDNRIKNLQCLKKINCYNVKEGDSVGSIKILYPPKDNFYLLNYKNSSIVLQYKDVMITYNLTKDIFYYLHFYKKYDFKLLIAYKFFGKIKENFIILNKKGHRGYIEIYPDNLYEKDYYLKKQNLGLLKLLSGITI